MKLIEFCFIFCYFFSFAILDKLDLYRKTIKFTVFCESYPNGKVTQINDTLEAFNCDPQGNTTFVVHGWLESIDRPWAKPMINEFLKLRGNCVFFMDYSFYSVGPYSTLTLHFNPIADLLVEKIRSIAVPEYLVMFGFSFGARLVTRAGALILSKTNQKVEKIYACDPAGPGFDPQYKLDPKMAAKFVACIHTSNTYGTKVYNCHQDWRLGDCGHKQPGARPFPYGSHGLCPYFFLASFTEDFVQKNVHRCKSNRKAQNLPNDLILGPRETRVSHTGDIFAPTSKDPPWSGNLGSGNSKITDLDFFEYEDKPSVEWYNELQMI